MQIWPPDGATYNNCKFGYQMAPLALIANYLGPIKIGNIHVLNEGGNGGRELMAFTNNAKKTAILVQGSPSLFV